MTVNWISGDGCQSCNDRQNRKNFSNFVDGERFGEKGPNHRILAISERVESADQIKGPKLIGKRHEEQSGSFAKDNDEQKQRVVKLQFGTEKWGDDDKEEDSALGPMIIRYFTLVPTIVNIMSIGSLFLHSWLRRNYFPTIIGHA